MDSDGKPPAFFPGRAEIQTESNRIAIGFGWESNREPSVTK